MTDEENPAGKIGTAMTTTAITLPLAPSARAGATTNRPLTEPKSS